MLRVENLAVNYGMINAVRMLTFEANHVGDCLLISQRR